MTFPLVLETYIFSLKEGCALHRSIAVKVLAVRGAKRSFSIEVAFW